MYDLAILWDWIAFSVRWLHVITAMAWIGASFYFIALDLMLKPNDALPDGASGEEWEVHGGGFYHTVKYLVAPARMPEPPDLAQMAKLFDMAVGCRAFDDHLLGWR